MNDVRAFGGPRVRVITTDGDVLQTLSQLFAGRAQIEWVQSDQWPDSDSLDDADLTLRLTPLGDGQRALVVSTAHDGAPIQWHWPLLEPTAFVASCLALSACSDQQAWSLETEVLRVLHADQRAGRAIQARLLPSEPLDSAGLRCELGFFPSLLLSGDFADYFQADRPSRVVTLLADVAGHGVSSAMVTVIIKSLINRLRRNLERASSFDLLSPARMLERINSELMSTGLGKHATVFVGLFDAEQRRLNYAVAGHTPMPVLVVDGHAQVLPGQGRPVGLFADVDYRELSIDLPDSEFYLVLASDGALDLVDATGLAAQTDGLTAAIASCGGSVETLAETLGLDRGQATPDDVTLVMVRGAAI